MKIFFESPSNEWGQNPGRSRAWRAFLESITSHAPSGSVVGNRRDADIVIHSSYAQLDTQRFGELIKPLTSGDVSHFVWDWGDLPTGRYSGFYCGLPSRLFDFRRHRTLSYPIGINELIKEYPQSAAKYDFGFVGGISATIRIRLYDLLMGWQGRHNMSVLRQGGDWKNFAESRGGDVKESYARHLEETKFILCPRGYSPGSLRMFEAMKAGRVPVIISDKYVLPSDIDWDHSSIIVPEKDIAKLPEIIGSKMDAWPQMAGAARQVWEDNFSEHKLVSYMIKQLQQIVRPPSEFGIIDRLACPARAVAAALEYKVRPAAGMLKQKLFSAR